MQVNTTTFQIVDKLPEADFASLRAELPYGKLVQIILVIDEGSVKEAIEKVQPFGVDVCSGVRTNGKLVEEKLAAFFREIE